MKTKDKPFTVFFLKPYIIIRLHVIYKNTLQKIRKISYHLQLPESEGRQQAVKGGEKREIGIHK